MDPLTTVLIFFAYFMLDVLHANYIRGVVGHKPFRAAPFGSSTYIVSALGVLSYTDNVLYLIPMVLGSWFGIFFVVKKEALRVAKTANPCEPY